MKETIEVLYQVISQCSGSGPPKIWGEYETKEMAEKAFPIGEHDGYGGIWELRKVVKE